jgi:hypothetical protein
MSEQNPTPDPTHEIPQAAAPPAPGVPAPSTPPAPAAVPAPSTPSTEKPRFQDRVLGMKAVAGVALASVILGGAGGAALGAVSNGSDEGARGGRFGGPMLQGNNNQLLPPGMNGVPGQGMPALPPQQTQPGSSGDSTNS